MGHVPSSQADQSPIFLVNFMPWHEQEYLKTFNNVMKIKEPHSYSEAALQPGWVAAMEAELRALASGFIKRSIGPMGRLSV